MANFSNTLVNTHSFSLKTFETSPFLKTSSSSLFFVIFYKGLLKLFIYSTSFFRSLLNLNLNLHGIAPTTTWIFRFLFFAIFDLINIPVEFILNFYAITFFQMIQLSFSFRGVSNLLGFMRLCHFRYFFSIHWVFGRI